MTRDEILLSTLEYYTIDPINRRCVSDEGYCQYSPITALKKDLSEGCAIGRLLDKDLAREIDVKEWQIGIDDLIAQGEYTLPEFMNKENSAFLYDVQVLHDINKNWKPNGLSFEGVTFVRNIIYKHDLNLNLFTKFLNN